MPNPQLLQQYKLTLQNSRSYKTLSPEEQNRLLTLFDSGTDDQINLALAELQQDVIRQQQLDQQEALISKQEVEMLNQMKSSIKEGEKEKLKTEEEKNTQTEVEKLKNLDSALNQASQEETKPKKKFLGLF